ncbi:MAG TPA: UDP-N-acetylmuramoyl-L-alanine--D-glutamate ligase, partial [Actinomycetota bacterium]|nr:UDP-N-acetylmuramoyl-L-alanine--D-glutamate ligase [Actinomycetota bacterium]
MTLAERRALVLGLAESGVAAAEALLERGAHVRVSEARPPEEVAEAAARVEGLGAEVLAGGHD